MADSRPGGIEKIAHLFIAGNGASNVRARDNSPLRWSGPAAGDGNGIGHGQSGATGAPGRAPEPPVTGLERPAADVGAPADPPTTTEAPEKRSQDLGALPSLLSRAKVAAVLSGHMGPLAGPAAELFAKTLAREGTRTAMLYGPADLACLHRFSANNENSVNCQPPTAKAAAGSNGNGSGDGSCGWELEAGPCDVLLLPDWVFQFGLWPMTRGVHSICLSYGAGSEGLMSAYGALKSLVSQLGKPEELLLLPFGCNEQEETWVHERLAEMCRRFLELEPRQAHEMPDMHVHASKLLPIDGGSEGVKQLFAAIGQPMLTLVPRRSRKMEAARAVEPAREVELPHAPEPNRKDETEGPVMADRQVLDVDTSAEVTPLVPVAAVPRDGETVLRALIEQRQQQTGRGPRVAGHGSNGNGNADGGGFFDTWSRQGVSGAVLGNEGLIGAAGEIRDLLGFALWLCRQAKVNDLDELASITIAVRQPEEWLIEAAQAMPVPVRWVKWRAFELGGQVGLAFETVVTSGNG